MSRRKTAAVLERPRVAFDTGVLLHALLLSDDKAQRLRQAWLDGACVPLVDAPSAQALMRALAYPALALDAAQQQELLADFLPYAEVVETPKSSRRAGSPALLLAGAEAARADCLVSNCERLRSAFSRQFSRHESAHCRLLGSVEFLDSLPA